MTERLYYNDSYLVEFRARVVAVSPDAASPDRRRVYLDRTAFYPTSGGQPFDTGELGGLKVLEVADEGDRIAHVLAQALPATEVDGRIDLDRRFDHMQQHTGQHLLSAVLMELFDAPTLSFHLGAEACTIDVEGALGPEQLREAERRANQIVFENRPVTVSFEDSSGDLGLRKATEREGLVRIVSIDRLDRSACGGTHVRATGEIGPILIRKLDRIRGNLRIEFLCGGRSIVRARADFDALSKIARVFSSPLDETPALVDAQREKLQESERTRRRLSTELAQASGRALYGETVPGPDGIRRALRHSEASLTEESRTEALSLTSAGPSVFLALAATPPSVLLAASKDSGVNCGEVLKRLLGAAGGRGGGNATLAQGSLPSKTALEELAESLSKELNFPA
jgi:alanyl-tRNA synthetase